MQLVGGISLYQICYKGKVLVTAMDRSEAEAMLLQLQPCFNNLELVEWNPPPIDLSENKENQVSA